MAWNSAAGFEPVGVPFKHLVVVAQAARFDLDAMLAILERTGYPGLHREAVAARLTFAQQWLTNFAPEDLKFELKETLPPEAASLTEPQRTFLARLADALRPDLDGEAIHALVYALAREVPGAKPAELFQAMYLALLGKPRGPRAGWFVAALGAEFCAARFREAAGERTT